MAISRALFLPVCLSLAACSHRPEAGMELDGDGVFALAAEREDRARLRYEDGQVSVNDSCAIRVDNRLNPRIPPMYVNGRPIGFC